MRRVLLILAPVAVVLITGVIFSAWRAGGKDPIGPMRKYVTYRETRFVPARMSYQPATLETWVWVKKEWQKEIPAYGKWLTNKQGWTVRGDDAYTFSAWRGGTGLVPDDGLWLGHSGDDTDMILVYTRRLSKTEAFFFSHYYKTLDFNSPRPAKP